MDTVPPDLAFAPAASPAWTTSRPPAPELPAPTTRLMLPPVPLVASPVRSTTAPDEPFLVVPDPK